ncbi:MAG: YdcF family protein [Calothrix sp. C42_A2020_038]|nr:YdcF family protein [Calothrix sp. C42_A2020_038]
MLPKSLLLHWRLIVGVVIMGSILSPLTFGWYVNAATNGRRYTDPTKVPTEKVAVVFGAGIRPDGTPTPMLADRVAAAVDLYKLGRVQKLLMTGDNSRNDYDEVTAMQRYAVSKGVPIEDITLDHAGFSTYESCYRAKEIFGVKEAILVTQNFHLPRAVYTCRQLGIEATGFGTPDWGIYSKTGVSYYTAREKLSTLKALWEVHVTRPLPTFLGRFEGIQ